MNRQQKRQLSRQDRTGGPAPGGAAAQHEAAGRWPEAVAAYRDWLKRAPEHAGAREGLARASYNRANAAARAGQLADAIAGYREAVGAAPGLAAAHGNLVRALLRAGAGAAALEAATAALGHVDDVEVRRLFVRAAAAAGRALSAAERGLLTRAFLEGWGRMPEVARAATATLRADLDEPTPTALAGNALLLAHLVCAPIADERLETGLRAVRERLLREGGAIDVLGAFAQQGFVNEYVWAVSPEARDTVAGLRERVRHATRPEAGELARLAMFEPLERLESAGTWLEQAWPAPVAALLRQQVAEPREERALLPSIPALTAVVDPVSMAVRAQYEANPYPRWVTPDQVEATTLEAFLRRVLPGGGFAVWAPTPFRMLIAGCGTGQHALTAARRFPGAEITAIDLSLASLAYAVRRSRADGAAVQFAQADILALAPDHFTRDHRASGTSPGRFDVIDATGVLHHLGDPLAGWQALTGLLAPGGFMRVGLYSRLGRRHVAAAQEAIRAAGLGENLVGARQALRALPAGDEARQVVESYDFYTASTCRDLLLHVQEHWFDLGAIKAALRDLGLRFLGFDLPDGVLPRFLERFGPATDLDAWAAFEAENPRTFTGMYQFWATRR